MHYVGVDGCRDGWIAVSKTAGELTYAIFKTAGKLIQAHAAAERILIDVPIGLPWKDAPIRPCDHLARKILGARRSSVFPVPCRSAVSAETFEAATSLNKTELGRGLSKQTWGISPKIREVDSLLLDKSNVCGEVREVHPEVCFWALAGRSPMKHNKKDHAGYRERLRVLTAFEPEAEAFVTGVRARELNSTVTNDDVLDALVAFITACAPASRLGALCGTPKTDDQGLPMEMVYIDQ
jgi:predicted RNase H-like nuclease